MSKTLYQQINNYCEMGYYPIVSNGDCYLIVSPFKDRNGYWRDTGVYVKLSDAKIYVGEEEGLSSDTLQDIQNKSAKQYKVVGFHHPPTKRFKVGDKVRVREDLKDLQLDGDWSQLNDNYQATAGCVGRIQYGDSVRYDVYFDAIGDWFSYSQDQLEPYIELEEEQPQTINIGGKQYKVTDELTKALKNLKEVK